MPVPLRTTYHKAEAKYNVTTEFPALGLHSAAANGNVGLVEYALDHGQPVNSVLDGVLPLHAACAGGNVQVVKLLIEHGADVNAPRLPRRYLNDRNRDTSAPIVGSSGSTPLHFAAANGNTEVVSLLLRHGAHANLSDKHGVTALMLAKENKWEECANRLEEWILHKDSDLKEREGLVDDASSSHIRDRVNTPAFDADASSSSSRRRLHVKHSLDTALSMFKTSSSNLADSYKRSQQPSYTSTPPASPHKPLGEYTFYPDEDGSDARTPIDPTARRPSLPHVLQSQDDIAPKQVTASSSGTYKSRRPRSAGNGADRTTEQVHGPVIYGRGGAARKLGSKYSLMNLFKKGQGDELSFEGDSTLQDSTIPSSSRHLGSATTLPISASPNQNSTLGIPSTFGGEHIDTASTYDSSTSCSPFSRSGFRFHRGSDASTRSSFQQPERIPPQVQRRPSSSLRSSRAAVSSTPEPKQATRDRSRSTNGYPTIDEHANAQTHSPSSSPLSRLNVLRSQGHRRDRSGSASSILGDSNSPARPSVFLEDDNSTPEGEILRPPARPGILRAHNRSSSNGHANGAFRALRFDSSSEMNAELQQEDEHLISLRPSISTGSFANDKSGASMPPGSTGSGVHASPYRDLSSAPAAIGDFKHASKYPKEKERDENDYGHLLAQRGDHVSQSGDSLPDKATLMRHRGLSFASSQSSLSPILSNDGAAVEAPAILARDFPFSIHRPPPLPLDSVRSTTIELEDHINEKYSSDLSSYLKEDGSSLSKPLESGISAERSSTPPHIDLSSISSHAQAEALVQKARQEALEMANTSQEITLVSSSTGRTPLSAKLAAYGETLALEKRLREQKEAQDARNNTSVQTATEMHTCECSPPSDPSRSVSGNPRRRRDGVERQHSLESKPPERTKRRRPGDVKRPSTADGLSGRNDRIFSYGQFEATNINPISNSSYLSPSERTDSPQRLPPELTSPCACSENQPEYNETLDANDLIEAEESISLTSSTDDTYADMGLSRVSSNIPRGKREQDRSAKKLTRMGLPPSEQGGRAPPVTPKRFGAIKSLMQSFKGKP